MRCRANIQELKELQDSMDILAKFLQRISRLPDVTYIKTIKYEHVGESTSSMFGYEYMVRDNEGY